MIWSTSNSICDNSGGIGYIFLNCLIRFESRLILLDAVLSGLPQYLASTISVSAETSKDKNRNKNKNMINDLIANLISISVVKVIKT